MGPKTDAKNTTMKASKKQSIEKLSEKLLHEGYPLTKSEKVERVLDMTEKKFINSKSRIIKDVNDNKVVATEKKLGKQETKTPEVQVEKENQEEQPVVLRNKMQVVPYIEKKSGKGNMEELYRKMKTECQRLY